MTLLLISKINNAYKDINSNNMSIVTTPSRP